MKLIFASADLESLGETFLESALDLPYDSECSLNHAAKNFSLWHLLFLHPSQR